MFHPRVFSGPLPEYIKKARMPTDSLRPSSLHPFLGQPSLLPLVDFLVNVFGWRLPQETCVSCEKRVMPDDPRGPSLKDPKHKDRPTRQGLIWRVHAASFP